MACKNKKMRKKSAKSKSKFDVMRREKKKGVVE